MKNSYIFLMLLFGTAQVSICMNIFSSKKQQLFQAIEKNDLTAVEKLITKNQKIINTIKGGYNPLHRAVIRRNEPLAMLLLDKNANIETQVELIGWTPLHCAVFEKDESLVALLLDKNANIEAQDNGGDTPLQRAVVSEKESLVKLLLDKNANIEARDEGGSTPLQRAVARGKESLGALLLSKGANIEAQDNKGSTPLHKAVDGEYESQVALLLGRGANIEAQDNNGMTPLHRAVGWCEKPLVTLLLDRGANIEAQDDNGWTPLRRAVSRGTESLVTLLLDKKANIEAQDNKGITSLRSAQERGYQNIVNLLKQKQLSSNASNTSTSTSAQKNVPMIEDEIELSPLHKGANIEARNVFGETPLTYAQVFADVIELSPLFQAVQENNYSKVQELTVQSADINQQTESGVTALMLACTFGYIDIVRFLLDRGVDRDLKDAKGKTAFDCARNNNHQPVIKLLRERVQYASTASKSSNVFVYDQITSQGASSSTSQYANLKLLPAEGSTNKH